ncbi:MAG: polysaccharide deacetylase family protein [Hyphomicrobiaceae bacterium]
MRLGRSLVAVIGLAGLFAGAGPAHAQKQSACGADAIGLARTARVDTKGGPHFGNLQYRGDHLLKEGEVVLTFDDGPHKAYTPAILQTLDAHCTKATFFMVGRPAIYYPGLVREVAHRGHTVATHTWSHKNLGKSSAAEGEAEIELGISAVQKALGQPAAPFFRFPYLAYTKATHAHLSSRNTGVFSIDVDSYDFRTRSPTVMMRNVLKQLEKKRRGIILFHDIQPSTAKGLDALLVELKRRGFRVVHLQAMQPQTTIASYDSRVGNPKQLARLASLPVPVSKRGIVSPAWEVSVLRGSENPYTGSAFSPKAPTAADAPSAAAAGGPKLRRTITDDWRRSVFQGW